MGAPLMPHVFFNWILLSGELDLSLSFYHIQHSQPHASQSHVCTWAPVPAHACCTASSTPGWQTCTHSLCSLNLSWSSAARNSLSRRATPLLPLLPGPCFRCHSKLSARARSKLGLVTTSTRRQVGPAVSAAAVVWSPAPTAGMPLPAEAAGVCCLHSMRVARAPPTSSPDREQDSQSTNEGQHHITHKPSRAAGWFRTQSLQALMLQPTIQTRQAISCLPTCPNPNRLNHTTNKSSTNQLCKPVFAGSPDHSQQPPESFTAHAPLCWRSLRAGSVV